MQKICFSIIVLLLSIQTNGNAQFISFSPTNDSTKQVTIEGYADIYFGFDFNQPQDASRPYFVSHSRHNETNVNLAYISVKYTSDRARATFTPGFGTYMNANYATERVTLRNIVEANIGVRPFKNKQIWIDAGVLPAPYTTENAIAHDQLLYTRSFAAEFSPYFLTGIRATIPLSKKVSLYLYVVNGWQVIEDINAPLSFGSALEWKPNDKLTINWSTYAGSESSALQPQYKGRFFSDLYVAYVPNKKLSLSADVYAGRQKISDSLNRKSQFSWWQANINGSYNLTKDMSVRLRGEYFNDAHSVIVIPVNGTNRFDCGSASLGYKVSITNNVAFHAEGRYFISGNNVFYNKDKNLSNHATLLVGGLTAKF